ncbi:PEP-CTERM sorting domain-containing protein [bacterium]|nr:PEP-CTERM sorting domain-containing protein [bacterium]
MHKHQHGSSIQDFSIRLLRIKIPSVHNEASHLTFGQSVPNELPFPLSCFRKKGKIVRCKSFIFVSILSLAITATAGAVDVFGNGERGSNSNLGGYNYNSNNAWAVPFTPGTSTPEERDLAGAWVLVGGNNEIEVTFDFAIYDDAGTNQGPTGSSLASGSLVMPAGSLVGWRFVTFISPVTLTANANYYVSLEESTGLGGFIWAAPLSMAYSDLGSGSDYSITSGGIQNIWKRVGTTWSDAAFSVDTAGFGFQLTTVPEPSNYALAGIAAITMGYLARRRKSA